MPPEQGPSDGLPPTDDTVLAGRYRLGPLLGQGGMGRVWEGTDELLGRDVAIKELTVPPGVGENERSELHTRMIREARTAAKLSHPSIVTIYDAIEVDGRPWIIMELVRAKSLSELIGEHGTLPCDQVAGYARQLVDALVVAHARGVVHRDVKPGNVLITPGGRVVLTDFGIAVLDGDSTLTRTGVLVGSPAYLAPEVARGQTARPPADLWSLGTTIYAALTGRSPFHRDAPLATLTAIISEDPPIPESAGALRPVLEGLLRKDPQQRMTAAQAAQVLRKIAAGTAPSPPADRPESSAASQGSGPAAPRTHGGRKRGRRRPALVAATAAAAVLAITGLIFAALNTEVPLLEPTPVAGSSDDGADTGTAEEETEEEAAAEPAGPPEGMHLHEDETGFSVHVPADWEMARQGNSVFFHNPGGGYLQIDQTTTPGDDALTDWQNQEGAISGNFTDYERVGMAYADNPDLGHYITAADWEFTHTTSEHGQMRAVNRAFHTDEYGYALFLNLPESEWEAGGREVLEESSRSFTPAG